MHALEEHPIKLAEEQARDFFKETCEQHILHAKDGDLWIFGKAPTALDAQMVVFVERLLDAHRHDLVPAFALDCSQRAIATPEWENVMQRRRTLPHLADGKS